MSKRIFCLLVFAVILLSGCVAESMVEVPFSFMGVEWGMAQEKIGKILGEEPMRQESYDPSVDMTTTLLGFSGIECLGYKAEILNFLYIDDALVMISCSFDEAPLNSDTDKLLDALTALYGEPAEVYDDNHISLSDMLSGTRTRAEWAPDANTSIALTLANQDSVFEEEFSPYFCSVMISNPPVLEAIQEAMFDAWDESAD